MARSKDVGPNPLDELRRNLERLKLRAILAHLDQALEQAATLLRRSPGAAGVCSPKPAT